MEKTSSNSQQPNSQNSHQGGSNTRKNSAPADGLAAELQALPQRDFLQESALGFIELLAKNKNIVGGLLLICLLGFAGWTAMNALRSRSELKAQDAFFSLETQYSKKKAEFDQARFADLAGQKTDGLKKPSGDIAKDYGNLVDELEAFAKAHIGTTAGAQAAILAAEARLSYNQADRAMATFDAIIKDTKTSTIIGALTRMAAANTFATAGKCEQAVKSWEEILATKTATFLHGEAALRAGLCLEKSGDKSKAAEMYRKASADSERSSSAQTAKALLRAIEMGS